MTPDERLRARLENLASQFAGLAKDADSAADVRRAHGRTDLAEWHDGNASAWSEAASELRKRASDIPGRGPGRTRRPGGPAMTPDSTFSYAVALIALAMNDEPTTRRVIGQMTESQRSNLAQVALGLCQIVLEVNDLLAEPAVK